MGGAGLRCRSRHADRGRHRAPDRAASRRADEGDAQPRRRRAVFSAARPLARSGVGRRPDVRRLYRRRADGGRDIRRSSRRAKRRRGGDADLVPVTLRQGVRGFLHRRAAGAWRAHRPHLHSRGRQAGPGVNLDHGDARGPADARHQHRRSPGVRRHGWHRRRPGGPGPAGEPVRRRDDLPRPAF